VAELFDDKPPPAATSAYASLPDADLGWLRLSRFPADAKLPTLNRVLRENHPLRVVRYRPGTRCTLRVDDPHSGTIRFAKVFPDQRGAAIHRDSEALWATAERGELDFRVAPPDHWDDEQLTLWQGCVPGVPIADTLYSGAGIALAERIGRAAASLPCSLLRPVQVFEAREQMQRSSRYAERMISAVPALAPLVGELMTTLERLHADCGAARLVPIHGALHVHQWLDDGERLGLVDFDRFGIGHAELDAATFIAELDYENPVRKPVEALSAAFLEAYQVRYGVLNRRLFQTYRAHKHLSKALKAVRTPRADSVQRAERNLRRALQHCHTGFNADFNSSH
jgi:hypothetical protein